MKKKLVLILLLFFNLYFFSFFIYFKRLPASYFVDSYKSSPLSGPMGVSVFVPFYAATDKPAGVISCSISYCYLPMIVIWEKRGIGVFCVDLLSVSKLTSNDIDLGERPSIEEGVYE